MADVLNMKTVTIDPAQAVVLSVTGNVATRVVTRDFWLPDKDDTVADQWDRDDGEELSLPGTKLVSGKQNHFVFAARMAPVEPKGTSLFITFQVRQGDKILLKQTYARTTSDPTVPVAVDDGIAFA